MPRKPISFKTNRIKQDVSFKHIYVYYLINYFIQHGKKSLAKRIVIKAFDFLENMKKEKPILLLEKAIAIASPRVELQNIIVNKKQYRIPQIISYFSAMRISIKWMVQCARQYPGKFIHYKLARIILETSKKTGSVLKKKEELYAQAHQAKAELFELLKLTSDTESDNDEDNEEE